MFIQELKKKQGKKIYRSVLIRESFREDGKVKHRTIANISKLPEAKIQLLKLALSDNPGLSTDASFELGMSKEFGASNAFLKLAGDLELDKILYSRKCQWREDILAMIVGRIVFQGSKLSLVNQFKNTALWDLCGHDSDVRPNVDLSCYLPMDRLLERQEKIQKKLVNKHLNDGCLVLYDMTNFWVEGEYKDSELVTYGKAKDGRRGYKQVAIGLITNKEGCPVAVETFSGNTSDQSTVWNQAQKLANKYGVKEVIFTGDRGMLTAQRIEEVSQLGYKTLTALTHPQIRTFLENNSLQPELFDERNNIEVKDPEQPGIRFTLCKNPETMKNNRSTRNALIERTKQELNKIAETKQNKNREKLCARVGKVLNKYRVGKYFNWEFDAENKLSYSIKDDKLASEEALDGCYIIRTDATDANLNSEESVFCYKQLTQVEQAFRNLKTVALELRPVYHKSDERIRAHVFLCMLAYYLQWHAIQRLQQLFEADKKGQQRHWTFQTVIETLKSIREQQILLKGVHVDTKITSPTQDQQTILDLLKADKM